MQTEESRKRSPGVQEALGAIMDGDETLGPLFGWRKKPGRGRPKNKVRTRPYTYYLPPALAKRIALLAVRHGTDRSRVVRDALGFALNAGPESWGADL